MAGSRALITGVGGQDGSLLARLLLGEGYEVAGVVRREPEAYAESLGDLVTRIELVRADLLHHDSLVEALRSTRPTEVYNLAAPSFVPRSWDEPILTAEFAAVGVTSMLEAIRRGRPGDPLLPGVVERDLRRAARDAADRGDRRRARSRRTASRRRTPTSSPRATAGATACSRAAGSSTTTSRRCGRSTSCRARSRAPPPRSRSGSSDELVLGDLDARRDWGYAGDYVRAMWLMLQQDEPGDYVVATGETHSVEELVEQAFARGRARLARLTSAATRRSTAGAAELHDLVGDAAKARQRLGWKPEVELRRARPAPRRGGARAAGSRRNRERVDLVVRAGRLVPGEGGRPRRTSLAQLRGAVEGLADARRDRRRALAGRTGPLRRRSTSGSEPASRRRDRTAAGDRLERRQPEALVEAREDERGGTAVERHELVASARRPATRPRPAAPPASWPTPVSTSRSSGRSARSRANASNSRSWFLCGHGRAG